MQVREQIRNFRRNGLMPRGLNPSTQRLLRRYLGARDGVETEPQGEGGVEVNVANKVQRAHPTCKMDLGVSSIQPTGLFM